MGTPLGDFIRARRDSIQPESVGLRDHGRRRAPGLRRVDLAGRAGVSVEYLTRIEQGRDRNPSPAVVNALADALGLDAAEWDHLRYLAKITGGTCPTQTRPTPPRREVRPPVLRTLRLLEPGLAVVTNRLGDLLAHTGTFELLVRGTGLLDGDPPNLTRFTFVDPRSRELFADWDDVADEQAFNLWRGPSVENAEWLTAELAPVAGVELTRRLNGHKVPKHRELRLDHPDGPRLRLLRETLEIPADDQQVVVYLPADEQTAEAIDQLRRGSQGRLRCVS